MGWIHQRNDDYKTPYSIIQNNYNGVVSYSVYNKDGCICSHLTIQDALEKTFECPSNFFVKWDLRLEVGKKYRRRNDSIVKIIGTNNQGDRFTNGQGDYWNKNGSWLEGEERPHQYDLIEEIERVKSDTKDIGLLKIILKESINNRIETGKEIPVEWIVEYNKIIGS